VRSAGSVAPDGAGVVAAALVGLTAAGGVDWATGLSVGLGGVLVAGLWRRLVSGGLAGLWFLPALAALGTIAALSPANFAVELLAGAGALALVYWVARVERAPAGGPSPGLGLIVPGLGLALALLVPAFLAPPTAQVGLAGVLLALLLLALGWVIVAPEGGARRSAPP
jgi:hypothetical protein